MAKLLTDEELRGLMSDSEEQTNTVQEVPVTIFMKGGAVFEVLDVGVWAYVEHGIFAIGTWRGSEIEKHVLIPYGEVRHLEFDYEALERYADDSEEDSGNA